MAEEHTGKVRRWCYTGWPHIASKIAKHGKWIEIKITIKKIFQQILNEAKVQNENLRKQKMWIAEMSERRLLTHLWKIFNIRYNNH